MFNLVPYGRRRGLSGWATDADRLWETMLSRMASQEEQELGFPVDVNETEDEYIFQAELPGMEKENMSVSYEGNVLTIAAAREEESTREGASSVRRERRCGRFARQFYLENVDSSRISARYQQGVLEVTVPKQTRQEGVGNITIE